jgi:hypothetical protein
MTFTVTSEDLPHSEQETATLAGAAVPEEWATTWQTLSHLCPQ